MLYINTCTLKIKFFELNGRAMPKEEFKDHEIYSKYKITKAKLKLVDALLSKKMWNDWNFLKFKIVIVTIVDIFVVSLEFLMMKTPPRTKNWNFVQFWINREVYVTLKSYIATKLIR